jgi:predicted ATPase
MKDEREIYVITGGPRAGKTSVIEALKERGFIVLSDTTEELKAQSAIDGMLTLNESNEEVFHSKVARSQYKREQNVDSDTFFVDKGLIESGVYSRINKVRCPDTIVKHAKKRYKKVFFLEPAPDDAYTNLTPEEKNSQQKERSALRKEYQKNGYYVIDVPYMSVRQRANFIVKNVNDRSVKARVRDTTARYERHISAIALFGGFVFDSLTLTRIDKLYDNIVVIVYLLLTAFGIFLVNLYESGHVKSKIFRFFHKVFPFVIQFAFGGLFSAFTLFYSRSTDLSGSWPFLLILIGLLIGNEFLKKYYRRFTLQLSLLYFVIFSYLIFVLPIVLQKMNTIIFMLSGILSLVIIYYYIKLFKRFIPETYAQSKLLAKTSIITIFTVINVMYFTNYIPPIPLSLNDVGVYHNLFRNISGDFVLDREVQPWYRRYVFGDVLHITKGGSLYAYSSVYAPLKLQTQIVHKWEKWDKEKRKWITKSVIDFPVTGGRIEGYRGYSISNNISTGTWRISIENKRGQVIGRDNFTIKEQTESIEIIRDVL